MVGDKLEQDFLSLCAAAGIDPADMRKRSRLSALVRQRAIIARALRDEGYSYPQIGLMLGRDHSTIQYMCKEDYRARKRQAYYTQAPG